jgi:hypothetical protein
VADLIGSDGERRDRGQIILIAGLTLAVTFLALALIANTAIFTENLATRGDTTGSSDALLFRHEVEESAEDTISYLNENNVSDLPEKAETNIEENLSVQTSVKSARQGRVVDVGVDPSSAVVEARLSQENNSRAYTNATGEANWTLARNASQIRNAEFNVSTDDLENVTKENRSRAFNFLVENENSNGFWNMTVYEPKSASEDMNVTVEDEGGLITTCSESSANGYIVINVTDATVDGLSCSGLNTGFPGQNTTSFQNGDKIAGNYSINLSQAEDVRESDYNESANPVAEVEIESLTVSFTYETDSLRYETEFEVAVDAD